MWGLYVISFSRRLKEGMCVWWGGGGGVVKLVG